jgi:hypothetical protein
VTLNLCVPITSSTSCDQAVLVDQAAGVGLPLDAVPVEIDRFGEGFQRRIAPSERCGRCSLWWISYARKIRRRWAWFQMRVRSRSSRRHPPIQRSTIAFMRGVRTLQSTVRIPASARTASNAAVKFEPRVADHELDPVRLLAEVHQQVAGLLGGPVPGGMQSDSENPDAPADVLDHG